MIVHEASIKNLSLDFDLFKDLLDHTDFYLDCIVVSFDYSGDDVLDYEVLKKVYPRHEELVKDAHIFTISFSEAKKDLAYGFRQMSIKGLRTEDTNKRIENLFWKKIKSLIDVTTAKMYTTLLYGGHSQWGYFWIFIDEMHKKGLLIVIGTYH